VCQNLLSSLEKSFYNDFWVLDLGSWFWFLVFGFWFLVFGFWFLVFFWFASENFLRFG